MINGYEKASKEVVPAVRLIIARELKIRYNMTESRIAETLGIAQAAVSKYLNGSYSERVGDTASKVDMEDVNRCIPKIVDGNKAELKKCICTVCNSMNKFECKFSSATNRASEVK
jgi:predicted transcriptional regulator